VILTYELDLGRVKMNQLVKYLGRKLLDSKVIVIIVWTQEYTDTQTHLHTGPIA